MKREKFCVFYSYFFSIFRIEILNHEVHQVHIEFIRIFHCFSLKMSKTSRETKFSSLKKSTPFAVLYEFSIVQTWTR